MLTGDLVQLRPVRVEDLPTLYDLSADLDTWEERNPDPARPVTREEFDEKVARRRGATDQVEFAVTAEDQLVGRCTLMREDTLARHAEVGIGLTAHAVGKGYGTDALRVLVRYAFTRRNLRRLHLVVVASNERAIASYRKVGFVEEGRRREHCWVRGAYEDEVIMGLLRSEWLSPG
ncbi:MAG TPA: GNAT family protein [Jatrophihabitantaceae bacterium]